MKKVLLTILSCIFLFNFSQAQSFTTLGDTVTKDFSDLSVTNKLKNTITNTTNSSTTYTWSIISYNIPSGWVFAGFCDNAGCYNASALAGQSETSAMVHANGSITVNNGDTTHTDRMDVYPTFDEFTIPPLGSVAWMSVVFTDNNSFPLHKDTLTFICTNNKTTSINTANTALSENIQLYPNPANNHVNVVYSRSLNVKNIAVYNLIGRMVKIYKVGNTSAKLDIDDLPSGVYFVRLLNDKGIIVGTRRLTHQ